MSLRIAAAIFVAALVLRMGFALWAPIGGFNDGVFYVGYAHRMVAGEGYTNIDGSPAVQWAPGWSALLALLLKTFGPVEKLACYTNAVLGAIGATLTGALGATLFGSRIGAVSGTLWAFWPALIYYSGTSFKEPLFSVLSIASLQLLVNSTRSERHRLALLVACGASLGVATLVRPETLALIPTYLLVLWVVRSSRVEFLRASAIVVATVALTVAPWTLRNALLFDRVILISANGGAVFHQANHPGATGGQDFVFEVGQMRKYEGWPRSKAIIDRNSNGWVKGREFVRSHPAEALQIVGNKLRLTYLADQNSAEIIFGDPKVGYVDPATADTLKTTANVYWLILLGLSAIGVFVIRRSRDAVALVVGLLTTWLCVHAVFLGGDRFRVAEAPAFAMLAAGALVWLREQLPRAGTRASHDP